MLAQRANQDTDRQTTPDQAGNDRSDTRVSQSEGQSLPIEMAIIGKLRKTNDAEIALGQLVQQRSKDPTVKAIAEHMIHDHQEMNKQLEQLSMSSMPGDQTGGSRGSATRSPGSGAGGSGAGGSGAGGLGEGGTGGSGAGNSGAGSSSAPPSAPSGPSSSGAVGDTRTRDRNRASGLRSSNADSLSITLPVSYWRVIEQSCENDLKMTKDSLSKHEGHEFDMAYLGQQHVAHIQTLAELQAIEEVGPSSLKQAASQAKVKVNEHLTHIDQALESLKNNDAGHSGTDSKRGGRDSQPSK